MFYAIMLGAPCLVGLCWYWVWRVLHAKARERDAFERLNTQKCANCRYSLGGLQPKRCPGCGAAIKELRVNESGVGVSIPWLSVILAVVLLGSVAIYSFAPSMSTIEKLVVFGIAGAPFFGLLPVVVIWLTSRSRPRIPRRALLFVGASSILGQVAMVVVMLVLRPLEGTSWFGVYIVIFIAVPAWFASSALGALVGAIVIQCSLLDRALGFESRR